jgi:hypothetical protein
LTNNFMSDRIQLSNPETALRWISYPDGKKIMDPTGYGSSPVISVSGTGDGHT